MDECEDPTCVTTLVEASEGVPSLLDNVECKREPPEELSMIAKEI